MHGGEVGSFFAIVRSGGSACEPSRLMGAPTPGFLAAGFSLTRWQGLYLVCKWLILSAGVSGIVLALFDDGVTDLPLRLEYHPQSTVIDRAMSRLIGSNTP